MESNHPTGGLLRPAGFEDRMGHQTPAAPRRSLGSSTMPERGRLYEVNYAPTTAKTNMWRTQPALGQCFFFFFLGAFSLTLPVVVLVVPKPSVATAVAV